MKNKRNAAKPAAVMPAALFFLLAMLVSCAGGKEERQHPGESGVKDAEAKAAVSLVSPVKRPMELFATASGRVVHDTRNYKTISVRYGGRVEKLLVRYNFQPIRKGEKIMEIYSPGLVTAQQELLFLLEADRGNRELIAAARRKLSLLGMSAEQIGRLSVGGNPDYSLAIYSPYNGYIYENTGADQVREGAYLEKGQPVFRLVSTERILAEFDIPPDATFVEKGSRLRIIPLSGEQDTLEAEVQLLQSFYREGERFLKARVYLDNRAHGFLPGQLLKAEFRSRTDSLWCIPSSALVNLGTGTAVFRWKEGAFYPQKVRAGHVSGGWAELVSGLSPGDAIAREARYLASEGFIRTKTLE